MGMGWGPLPVVKEDSLDTRGGETGDWDEEGVADNPEELANPEIGANAELPDDRYESGLPTMALADRDRPESLDGSLLVLDRESPDVELVLLRADSPWPCCSEVSASSSSP
jgi:hypothetical protein